MYRLRNNYIAKYSDKEYYYAGELELTSFENSEKHNLTDIWNRFNNDREYYKKAFICLEFEPIKRFFNRDIKFYYPGFIIPQFKLIHSGNNHKNIMFEIFESDIIPGARLYHNFNYSFLSSGRFIFDFYNKTYCVLDLRHLFDYNFVEILNNSNQNFIFPEYRYIKTKQDKIDFSLKVWDILINEKIHPIINTLKFNLCRQ